MLVVAEWIDVNCINVTIIYCFIITRLLINVTYKFGGLHAKSPYSWFIILEPPRSITRQFSLPFGWCADGTRATCWQTTAVLDFLRNTYVGRTAPPVEENYESESSEADPEEIEACRAEAVGTRESLRSKRNSDLRAFGCLFLCISLVRT